MKYIKEVDERWHTINEEMPPSTTDVEFLNRTEKQSKARLSLIWPDGMFIFMGDGEALLITLIGDLQDKSLLYYEQFKTYNKKEG